MRAMKCLEVLSRRAGLLVVVLMPVLGMSAAFAVEDGPRAGPHGRGVEAPCLRELKAEVVALEQAIVLNRLGAFNPAGMLYALREDVVFEDGSPLTSEDLRSERWQRAPGHVQLRQGKRPRPLVLRANEGDCLEVTLHNLLATTVEEDRSGGPSTHGGKVIGHMEDPPGLVYPQGGRSGRELVTPGAISNDLPQTRGVTFHVTGLEYMPVRADRCPRATEAHPWVCGYGQGDVGNNEAKVHPSTPPSLARKLRAQGGTVMPGQSAVYRFRAVREGTYFAYSNAATVGGEGDGGQLGLGLFGAVNVQPKDSSWYRSQVTHAELKSALRTVGGSHPYQDIDYDGARYASGPQRGRKLLAMLDGDRIVHSDLNAVVALRGSTRDHNDTTGPDRHCTDYAFGHSCGSAYREFTVILHDEVKAVQAFAELEDENNPLAYLKDGMGINYGTGGMGAMVLARNRKVGPARDCPECRAEEFFLSSWVNGDPSLVLKWDASDTQPVGAMYPDDPSNVHHSYLNDPVRFRNLHAGPKETHVFHLHAHQWVMDVSNPGSSYLDSQTISPGAGFSYEIAFGGAGNRNLTPGDSIFHCHLYPHFAQGMWELWRTHDVFEDGTPGLFNAANNPHGRNLEDAEVHEGIVNPAIVPLPGQPLPPMPTADFRGYPFYIAAEKGHRPPQPPLDHDEEPDGSVIDGGLPRHRLSNTIRGANITKPARTKTRLVNQDVVDEALAKGGLTARLNAAKVYHQNPEALTMLAEVWESIGSVELLPHEGTPDERRAMDYHAGELSVPGFDKVTVPSPHGADWNRESKGYRTVPAATVAGQVPAAVPPVFFVNGRSPKPGAPFADPCPKDAHTRQYKTAFIQTELTVNKHGWFDPQARILALEQDVKDIVDPNTRVRQPEPLFFRANSGECIDFKSSNFVPNALALDDFQIYTPTDTIGQHIHLVKFDVTSSDGSANGWNYEDGTFSPEEVQERVFAINAARAAAGDPARLSFKTHPLFQADCNGDALCEALKEKGECPANAHLMDRHELHKKHPLCGAQRTVQRWWADPRPNKADGGRDQTLRTVFTHDHFGPSSHQQHGLYAALVIEPANSVWLPLDRATVDWDAFCAASPVDRQKMVLGGAALAGSYDAQCQRRAVPAPVGVAERRAPLMVREDGGPTATRANIIAPKCLGRLDSSAVNPDWTPGGTADCPDAKDQANQTRREFALAFADFGIVYNTALEPINPEQRDASALRLGRRFVARNLARPLGISSEDPGSQFINYRHEPAPLRLADVKPDRDEPELGGFTYSQTRCDPNEPVDAKRLTCSGDPANLMSSLAHADRDRRLATQDYRDFIGAPGVERTSLVSLAMRDALKVSPGTAPDGESLHDSLGGALDRIEAWRRDFNCFVTPKVADPYGTLATARDEGVELSAMPDDADRCRKNIKRGESWRMVGDPATPVLPAYEGDPVQIRLVQGSQEAQHVFGMNGMHWLREPDHRGSGLVATQPLGISEHFEFELKPAPHTQPRMDYLYWGTSIDQLWDGLWGTLRVFGHDDEALDADGRPTIPGQPDVEQLFSLKGKPIVKPSPSIEADASRQVCRASSSMARFGISAVRACQVNGGCSTDGGPSTEGVIYSRRLNLGDPDALLFVQVNDIDGYSTTLPNKEVLELLKKAVKSKVKSLDEPLVLRAPAGACIEMDVRNHLPSELPDGPRRDVHGNVTGHFGHNFLPMITDGFNVNQFRMSSSVGLSTTMLAQHPITGDGSNVGLNSAEMASAGAFQGSLVPPCRVDAPSVCRKKYYWYAGGFELDGDGRQMPRALELGVLPLRSFGDPIKHPMHGLVGALVIGPEGSGECPLVGPAKRKPSRRSQTSANICDKASGKLLYRDFVAVLQDAVEMRQDGWPLQNLKGAEEPDDYGAKAVNYRTEPLWGRRGGDPSIDFEERNSFDYSHTLSTKETRPGSRRCKAGVAWLTDLGCGIETPTFVAVAGSEVRLRLVHPGGRTRQQAISLAGHIFNPHPYTSPDPRLNPSSRLFATAAESLHDAWIVDGHVNALGPMTTANLLFRAGGGAAMPIGDLRSELAGGRPPLPMDYLWRSQASFLFDGGTWGLLRVVPPGEAGR